MQYHAKCATRRACGSRRNHSVVLKRELVVPQSSFRVKDLVGTVAKSRGEWWIDATAATAWLQPADVVVACIHPYAPSPHTSHPAHCHSYSNDLLISIAIYVHPPPVRHPLSRSTPLPPGSKGVLLSPFDIVFFLYDPRAPPPHRSPRAL